MEFFNFKVNPPSESGEYLWIANNWNAMSTDGEPVHRLKIRIAEFKNGGWRENGRGLLDPDQWAVISVPPASPKPAWNTDVDAIRRRAIGKLSEHEREALGIVQEE